MSGVDALTVTSLTVRLGGVDVLTDVDLRVRRGEVIALVGPNGAGKSTLLGAVAGDLPMVEGQVEVDGSPVHGLSARELARRRAVLLQQVALSFPFSVEQVVRMGRTPWAGSSTESADDDEAVADAMRTTETEDLAARSFLTLSGGERARVALARVLAQRTPLLLLDEPTAALDLRHQEQLMAVCSGRAAAGGAVVVVLHDLGLAAAHAHRVVVLDRGRVVADVAPDALTPDLLSRVYRTPIDVLTHPDSASPLIQPARGVPLAVTDRPISIDS